MPEPVQPDVPRAERSAAERSADHAAIDRLSGDLLPALIAKLGATGMGELEVREGSWRVRLRRPGAATGSGTARERRPGERDRSARSGSGSGAVHVHASLTAVGPGREAPETGDGQDGVTARDDARADERIVASSPAVGIYQPLAEAGAGTKVRAGDRLGSVDMLGIPQEVVAPSDGVVGASLVEPGDAVEYGQDLILIEFASVASSEA